MTCYHHYNSSKQDNKTCQTSLRNLYNMTYIMRSESLIASYNDTTGDDTPFLSRTSTISDIKYDLL